MQGHLNLARLLSLRWAPELSTYDALYKIAATLIRKSNSFSDIYLFAKYPLLKRKLFNACINEL